MTSKKSMITMADLERIECLLQGDTCETTLPPKLRNYEPEWEMEGYSKLAECYYLAQLVHSLREALWQMADTEDPLAWNEVDTFEPHIEFSPYPHNPYVRVEWHFQGDDIDREHFFERRSAACGQEEKKAAEKNREQIAKNTANYLANKSLADSWWR